MTTLRTPDTEILIVDDNPQYTMVLKKILLSGFGFHNVTAVEDSPAALQLVTDDPERFRLMFVDFNLPGGETGGNLLGELKKSGLLENKVAFLITSDPTVDNTKQALAAGAYGVVAKPFDRDDIERQLEKAERALFLETVDSF